MKTKYLVLLGSISYLVFLLILTPAASIIPLLNIPKHTLSLSGVSGSLWSGSVHTIRTKQQTFDDSQWSLKPLSLLTGNVSADLTTNYKQLPVSTRLDYSLLSQTTSLSHLQSSFTATKLQDILQLPLGQLSGNIRVMLDSISFTPKKLPQVNGDIHWENAKLILSENIALGNLKLMLTSSDTSGLVATISNKQGQLSINGTLTVLTNQRYALELHLTPRSNAPDELLSILSLVAPKKVKSEHLIVKKGHLRDLGIKL